MGDEGKSGWLSRTNAIVGIGVGLVAIAGGVAALLAQDGGPSEAERYMQKLQGEVCTGELAAVAQLSNPNEYAGQEGTIDKGAWLDAMATVRDHLDRGLKRLRELPPPAELRNEWQNAASSWNEFIRFWDEWRAYTQALPQSMLTVFNYPEPAWRARFEAAENAFGIPLRRLIGGKCADTVANSEP